jgi:ribosomal protein L15
MKNILLWLILGATLLFSNTPYVMKESKIQGRLNIVNGYSSECMMHQFYTSSGWIKIEGEIGRNGIDGLYYKEKNGQIREVLVAESKWNTARLGRSGKNKLVKQMSQRWILRTLEKLQRHKPLPEYKTIKKFIKNDQYRARLFKVLPKGSDSIQIEIYTLKNKGQHSFDTFVERKLNPIKLHSPKNSFEKRMLKAYNTCRATALHKYFPTLKVDDVNGLLEGNYLKKRDVREVL